MDGRHKRNEEWKTFVCFSFFVFFIKKNSKKLSRSCQEVVKKNCQKKKKKKTISTCSGEEGGRCSETGK
jgi:hypothetical protein